VLPNALPSAATAHADRSKFIPDLGGAKRARTADLLHAISWQHIHLRPSPQVTVLARPSRSASIRTCCGTSVLYRSLLGLGPCDPACGADAGGRHAAHHASEMVSEPPGPIAIGVGVNARSQRNVAHFPTPFGIAETAFYTSRMSYSCRDRELCAPAKRSTGRSEFALKGSGRDRNAERIHGGAQIDSRKVKGLSSVPLGTKTDG